MNSPFLLNEHGNPQFFFQVFAKNSLIKNIFEEDKKFDSRKSAIFPQPGNQERLKWSNTAYVSKWNFTFKTKLCAFQVTKI